MPILSLLAPQTGGRWREMVDALYSIGLTSLLDQLAAVLLAFCVLVGVRAAVLAACDRLVPDLTEEFVDHRQLLVVTDLARALVVAGAAAARVTRAYQVERDGTASVCLLDPAKIMTAGITLVIQAIMMILLPPLVARLTIMFDAQYGRASSVVRQGGRYRKVEHALRVPDCREDGAFLNNLKIAVAHDRADAFIDQNLTVRCRLCMSNDEDAVVEHIAGFMWESRRNRLDDRTR
jgi:ATP-binding cassette subfamily C protein